MSQHNTPRLCFIGFGEASQAFENLRRAADGIGLRIGWSSADAITSADIVISAVTAFAAQGHSH